MWRVPPRSGHLGLWRVRRALPFPGGDGEGTRCDGFGRRTNGSRADPWLPGTRVCRWAGPTPASSARRFHVPIGGGTGPFPCEEADLAPAVKTHLAAVEFCSDNAGPHSLLDAIAAIRAAEGAGRRRHDLEGIAADGGSHPKWRDGLIETAPDDRRRASRINHEIRALQGGLGTNAGLKRLAGGEGGFSCEELLGTRRRHVDAGGVRGATLAVRRLDAGRGNDRLRGRRPGPFGAVDRNLATEWHARLGGRGVMLRWHVTPRLSQVDSVAGAVEFRGRRGLRLSSRPRAAAAAAAGAAPWPSRAPGDRHGSGPRRCACPGCGPRARTAARRGGARGGGAAIRARPGAPGR